MNKPPSSPNRTGRQIIGLSLPPDVAGRVKQEAAKRGLSLRGLFLEMWELYNTEGRGKSKG
ncbi:MAG: hypothetical protein OXP69_05510 [Spirochaetaceae bacterium]|nr:hypothetical protein [Spirochaetaceae bacterium]MDE0445941.1 hypothetical protein [Spirochaetaceae bacterium]